MQLYSYKIILYFPFVLQLGNVCSLYLTVLLNFSMPMTHTCTNLFFMHMCFYYYYYLFGLFFCFFFPPLVTNAKLQDRRLSSFVSCTCQNGGGSVSGWIFLSVDLYFRSVCNGLISFPVTHCSETPSILSQMSVLLFGIDSYFNCFNTVHAIDMPHKWEYIFDICPYVITCINLEV